MKLSESQMRFFETFGYVYMPELMSADEIESITAEFEQAIQEQAGAGNYDGSQRLMFIGPIDRTPRLCALLDNDRILGIATSLLGDDFNYASGDGNYYTGDTIWHPDGAWGRTFAIKIAFYLDPVGEDTGCLRVVPGSHSPEHSLRKDRIDPNQSMEMFGVAPRDFPGNVALESNPGDVVVFNHDLFHASFGGSSRRRMFTMNLTRHADTATDMHDVREYVKYHSPGGHKQVVGAGMYSKIMLGTAGEERMRHLSQMRAIHDQLFPELAN